jgi:hypothetical protein
MKKCDEQVIIRDEQAREREMEGGFTTEHGEHGVENKVLQQVEIGGKQRKSFGSNGIFKPPIERIFTNGERLRRRISSSA